MRLASRPVFAALGALLLGAACDGVGGGPTELSHGRDNPDVISADAGVPGGTPGQETALENDGGSSAIDDGTVETQDGGTPNEHESDLDAGESQGATVDGGDDPTTGGQEELPSCPSFSSGSTTGFVLDLRVKEASGVVEGRRNPGILWVHNDSGGSPEVFALTTAGQARGKFILDDAEARDWEDIAIGPGPDVSLNYLYIGDIGDNGTSRGSVQIYRVPEPVAGGALTVETLGDVERFDFQYPDGAHNAETLLVDPKTGDVYIVTKDGTGVTPVYRAAAPLQASGATTLEHVTTLQFESEVGNERLATGGDISVLGDEIVVRTYRTAFLWRRAPDATVAEALGTYPCTIPLVEEGQGEAIGFATDGAGYYTLGEGQAVGVHSYLRQ